MLFLLLCYFASTTATATMTAPEEISSLEYLFNSTNGDHWKYPNALAVKWIFTTDPCTPNIWAGVSCSCSFVDYCHVVQLTLVNYNLHGTIASGFSNLKYLNKISFSVSKNKYKHNYEFLKSLFRLVLCYRITF